MSDGSGRYLVFRVGDRRCALPLESVVEVADPLPEYPIPLAPRCLRGAVNCHGTLTAVLDLAGLMGLGDTGPGGALVVLDTPGRGLAVAVAQVEKVVASQELCGEEPADDGPPVVGTLLLDDGPVRLLAAAALLEVTEDAVAG